MFVLLAANSFDRGATAAELIVHRNTVRYRIQRIGEADRFGFTEIPWTRTCSVWPSCGIRSSRKRADRPIRTADKGERCVNCMNGAPGRWRRSPTFRDTDEVAITPSSTADFFRSVIRWLQVGYPEGVPGPDRVPLLALLHSTPLSEDEITEVVDAIDEDVEGPVDRDVIADFISDMTQYDAGPENIARVAARLAAAGWPLSGIADASNGEAAASQA
jgi:Protein of unknown function (DUF3349)/PucR C-terminal helix-turn-helix domain